MNPADTLASPNVSQRGRVATKSSSIGRRKQVKIRKSLCGPSSAILLAVLAPGVRVFGQGKTHHSPRIVVQRNWSRYLFLSAAPSCTDQQGKIKPILQELHDTTLELVQDQNISREERLSKIRGSRYAADNKIRTLLKDDQKKKLDQVEQEPHPDLHGDVKGSNW